MKLIKIKKEHMWGPVVGFSVLGLMSLQIVTASATSRPESVKTIDQSKLEVKTITLSSDEVLSDSQKSLDKAKADSEKKLAQLAADKKAADEKAKTEKKAQPSIKERAAAQEISHKDERGVFLDSIKVDATQVANEHNVYPSIMMAQATLESASGSSGLTHRANNFFGIKGDHNGAYSLEWTQEDYEHNGNYVWIQDRFRAYPDFYSSLTDYALLLRQGPGFDPNFYSGAWRENTNSAQDAANALTGTYATDGFYADKLMTIIDEFDLHRFDEISK